MVGNGGGINRPDFVGRAHERVFLIPRQVAHDDGAKLTVSNNSTHG